MEALQVSLTYFERLLAFYGMLLILSLYVECTLRTPRPSSPVKSTDNAVQDEGFPFGSIKYLPAIFYLYARPSSVFSIDYRSDFEEGDHIWSNFHPFLPWKVK